MAVLDMTEQTFEIPSRLWDTSADFIVPMFVQVKLPEGGGGGEREKEVRFQVQVR